MRLSRDLSKWLLAQIETMPLEMLRNISPTTEDWLSRMLGPSDAAEVRALLLNPPAQDDGLCIVFLPGMLGSLLASVRGISMLLWFNLTVILNGKLNLMDLDETGERDRHPQVDVVPVGIEKTGYLKTLLTLAAQARLFEFPYDWRKRLEWNAARLRDSLARWSREEPGRRFVLVGHSMGGLLARTYAALYPKEAENCLNRIILLASPIFGAPSVIGAFAGSNLAARILKRLHPDNHVSQLACRSPGVYQLLPPPPSLVPSDVDYPFDWDLYDAKAWHVPGIRQTYLDGTARLYRRLLRSDPQVEMWQIAGYQQPTIVKVCQNQDSGVSSGGAVEGDMYSYVREKVGQAGGDGVVPLWAVTYKNINMLYVSCEHSQLPGDDAVLRALIDLAQGETPTLDTCVQEPATSPTLLQQIAGQELGRQVEDLVAKVEAGTVTREDISKLFFSR